MPAVKEDEGKVIETEAPARSSMFGLIRGLTSDTRTFIRQEVQLAKTELSEKISRLGRNAVALAIGGFVAYAGLIVFLIGLGWLLAWAFTTAGLAPAFAGFLGLAVIGLAVVTAGCVLLLKGMKTLSNASLSPEKTLHTLQELRSREPAPEPGSKEAKAPSSEEMQGRVEATETRMSETLDELGRRLSPQHINTVVKNRIQTNPYQAGLLAMGAGILSGLLLFRKHRTA